MDMTPEEKVEELVYAYKEILTYYGLELEFEKDLDEVAIHCASYLAVHVIFEKGGKSEFWEKVHELLLEMP